MTAPEVGGTLTPGATLWDELDRITVDYAFRIGECITDIALSDGILATVDRTKLRAWAESNGIAICDSARRPIVWEGV